MAVRQETLFIPTPLFSLESFKEPLISKSAPGVVGEILNRNPKIERVSWVVYDWMAEYETIVDEELLPPEPLFWVEREEAGELLNTSREEALSILTGEKITKESLLVPAVSSLVVLGEKSVHIPQVDFRGTASTDELPERVKYFLSRGEWMIVNSGASYHAWGVDSLMTTREWRSFMEKVQRFGRWQCGSDLLIPDLGFIRHSLKRGFSALRIHEIPLADILEEPPPQIVRHIISTF